MFEYSLLCEEVLAYPYAELANNTTDLAHETGDRAFGRLAQLHLF